MKSIRKKNFKKAIILIKILDDNTLLVVDSLTTVRILDKENFELISGFKANIKHLRYKTNVLSFSSDGNYFASLSSDCKESLLYNVKTKKNIARVNRHQGEASCVGIDPLNNYMFSCGDDGKTFALDIKSAKLAFTLPVHVDTVNDIVFSKNAQWVATASYDRKIQVFNLAMMTPKQTLKAHSAPIVKLHFLSKHRLFSIDKRSSGIIWDIYSGKIIHRLQGIHDTVTQVTTDSENKFLFLGTVLGYILVYELETYKLLDKRYVKLSSTITSLIFDDSCDELIVGLESGEVLFYNIYYGKEILKELLQKRELEKIQKYIDDNPLLEYTKIYHLVSNLWERTLEKAKIALQKNDRQAAINLFKPFKNIPSKNTIMQKVMLEYTDFDKFVSLAQQGKIPLAYGLANLHPMYKESSVYKSLEAKWKQSFVLAQKYSMDPKGMDKAREILAPYRGLSDKTKLIQELFTQGKVYKRFRTSIGQKDFKLAFELIKQHPFLKEFPEYTTIMNYGDTLYIKSQELIKAGETHSAIKMLRILSDFSDFAVEVKELMQEIEKKQNFYKSLKDKDLIEAYNILDSSEELLLTDDGKRLQEQWNAALSVANGFAVEGNINGIKQTLKLYMKVRSKYMALGTLFGLCYMVQLENAIKQKKDRVLIENGIKNYLLSFGSLKMWRPSMIVNSILD